MKRIFAWTSLGVAAALPVMAAESLPSVDEILARNIEALGGRAAVEKVFSRSLKGKLVSPAVGEADWELQAKAPNKRLSTLTLSDLGALREGFDGRTAWTDSPQSGLRVKSGAELDRARREAEFHGELKLKQLFPRLSVKGRQRLGQREAFVVEAQAPGTGPERLFYDTESGLLLRREFEVAGAAGPTEIHFEYEDYRAVDGVKFPFVTRMPRPEAARFTLTLTEIKLNVPLEDRRFEKPSGK